MLLIREERPADALAIRQVHLAAFPGPVEADLLDRLRASGNLPISLCAEVHGEVLGHIAFSPVSVGGLDLSPVALGLAPVAVMPDRQRQGIGRQLIERGLELCAGRRAPLVVVLGDPDYYCQFGFATAADSGLDNEYGVHAEFMVWQPAAMRHACWQGLVRYGREFAELS